MSYTADYERSGRPGGAGPFPYYDGAPWGPRFHPAAILLTVLGFIIWWPIGLALLFYNLWSRNMGCGHRGRWADKMERMQWKMDRMRSRMEGRGFYAPSSGNRAFDEYRMETLRRLEEEQAEFKEFLERLRHAKDKQEFDDFMAQHRSRPSSPPPANNQPQG
jgi:hypothetical protein